MVLSRQVDSELLPTTFMGLRLFRSSGTLTPREETELLGTVALDLLSESKDAPRVIDMCCGCGNLASAIAAKCPRATVWASDLTDDTVAVSRANVRHLGLTDRVFIHQGDLFAGLSGLGLEGSIDLIVCNPPYISTSRLEGERAHLLDGEPREAFDGGPYGIAIHQRVIAEAPRFLRPGGWLAMEFGEGQDRQVKILLQRAGRYEPASLVADRNATPRVVKARLAG
jgi:release factor glutamine methyltransferase